MSPITTGSHTTPDTLWWDIRQMEVLDEHESSTASEALWSSECILMHIPEGSTATEIDPGILTSTVQSSTAAPAPFVAIPSRPVEESIGTLDSTLRALEWENRLFSAFSYMVRDAEDEAFFDGMESVFATKLIPFVKGFGNPAVLAIDRYLRLSSSNVEVSGETLVQLGHIDHPRTHHNRLVTLIGSLQSEDVRIRDAASLGIAALGDSSALYAVEAALEREPSDHLREDLQLVVDQLRATRWPNS